MAAPVPVSRRMTHDPNAARGVAMALLAGPWDAQDMRRSVTFALGRDRQPRWVHRLIMQVLEVYPSPPADGSRELGEVVQSLPAWLAGEQSSRPPRVVHWPTATTAMGQAPWPVADLPHLGAL